jgi:hypothetical protein
MSAAATAGLVLAVVFGAALVGMWLQRVLPAEHLSPDSKDVFKLAMGLVATLSALVLSLLINSAKNAFDVQDNYVKQGAANVILLDRTLAQYGSETKPIRDGIRQLLSTRIQRTWPDEGEASDDLDAPGVTPMIENIEDLIRSLTPQNDKQRILQAHALQAGGDVVRGRWLLLGDAGAAIQTPMVVVLVFWLAALFVGFGLFAPPNGTVLAVLFIAATAVAGSVFLILELNDPFAGMLRISGTPMRYALSHLGQ